jgi:excisionase family DNA binding protein
MSDNAWLSVAEAAESLGLSPGVVYRLASSGQVAHYKVGPSGGRIRFRPEDIAAYLEKCRVGPKSVAAAPAPRREYVSKYDHSKPGSPRRRP